MGHFKQDSGMNDHLMSEGDINLTESRQQWKAQNAATVREWLEKDERYFLHQSMSTPCLDVIETSHGSYIENIEGTKYLDFRKINIPLTH
jgi:4-aminobutyrate aminotransferase